MKKLSFLFAALMAVVSLQAQDEEKPRHEIGVSYGLGLSLIGDGIGHAVGSGIFDALLGYNWTNRKEFGTLGLEYFYHLPDAPRVALGGILTYASYGEDVEKDGMKRGDRKRTYMTLMPSVKYYYVDGKNFGLYSKAAVGVMMLHNKYSVVEGQTDSSTDCRFMAQVSLLGLEAGSQNVRGFMELGAGEQGIILIGLKCKF
jgi:hypothetical protein